MTAGEGTAAPGYIVLGMGKYGAFELNYLLRHRPHRLLRSPAHPPARRARGAAFFVRLTRDLVRLLHERTGDGYVFRTDLRLRPDPGATPLALSTDAALNYYESFGQNWERAALIKARAVAGDLAAGEAFLRRARALHLAQVPRLRGHRRHPRHEAADPRLRGLWHHRRRRPQHQGRPRRHPRDRVLRADPAADRRRPPAGAARLAETLVALERLASAAGSRREPRASSTRPIASCAASSTACR